MQKLKILNSKEQKQLLKMMEQQWGPVPKSVFSELALLVSSKDKLYIISKDFGLIEERNLRIDSIGLYFGERIHNELRLSIDGSQIIGPYAEKNVVELDEAETKSWFKGEDIEKKMIDDSKGFVLLRQNNDFLGCGKVKQGKILNFVPKARRITVD